VALVKFWKFWDNCFAILSMDWISEILYIQRTLWLFFQIIFFKTVTGSTVSQQHFSAFKNRIQNFRIQNGRYLEWL